MWFRQLHSDIALDAGRISIAACQLVRVRGGVRLHRWGLLEDPLRSEPGDDELTHRLQTGATYKPVPHVSVERAARLVQQVGFSGRTVSLALKPPEVSFHAAAIPAALEDTPGPQWLTMLRFEAARQMQYEPDGLEVDYWPLPPGNRAGANVMIAAVRRDALTRWCELCDCLGLVLRQVDVVPCALLRSGWRVGVPGLTPERSRSAALWGVLDIGFSSSLLAVALANRCVYVRSLSIGGDAFTRAIADALEVGYPAAELLKRQHGPAVGARRAPTGDQRTHRLQTGATDHAPESPPASASAGELSEIAHALHPVVRARIRALATEVERAFSYPMENYPEATPCGLYLCGGGARLPGLSEALRELLGVEVALLDPCRGVAPPARGRPVLPAEQASLGTCVGLALGDLA